MTSPTLDSSANLIVGSVYRHYKGGEYKVIALGLDADTHTQVVVYQGLYDSDDFGPKPVWVRSKEVFTETVEVSGLREPRFKLCS